ncbi:MAG: terminase small subunit [Chitinophagaceae bacterium]|nr:terminase small subunit [Chitinophagaceae bacterium]
MSTLNRKHTVFIKEMVVHGDQVKAYQKAYGCKVGTARVQSYVLLKNPTIADKIKQKRKEIEDAEFEAIKKERVDKAIKATIEVWEADAVLSEIITGKRLSERKVVVFNKVKAEYETVLVKETADHTAVVSAVREFYKRKGAYAPKDIKIGLDNPLLEFMKMVQSTSNKKIKHHVS